MSVIGSIDNVSSGVTSSNLVSGAKSLIPQNASATAEFSKLLGSAKTDAVDSASGISLASIPLVGGMLAPSSSNP